MKTLKFKIKSLFLIIAVLSLPALALAGSATYEYDAFDRLERAMYENGPVVEYDYDANGSLASRTVIDYVLHLSTAGTGSGSVEFSGGTSCGTNCYFFDNATTVTVTATPDSGYLVGYWNGAPCGQVLSCDVTVDSLKYVSPVFYPESFTVSTDPTAGGTITPAQATVSYGNVTSFTIIPDAGKDILSAESDYCGGSLAGDTYTTGPVTAVCEVSANFGYNLSVFTNITGAGSITSAPSGIDCGPTCSAVFALNTSVSLQAVQSEGYFFTGWSDGQCSGPGSCELTLDAEKAVTANYQTCATQTPVRIAGSPPTPYSTIQAAYDAAVDGDLIQTRELSITENVNLNRNISIRLEGGYNCTFEAVSGKTTVVGDITVSNGTVTIENVKTSP